MDRRIYNFITTIAFVLCVEPLMAAKILIVTDQPTQQKALEVKKFLESTPPFSMLKDFSVVIRLLPKNSVSCTRPLVDQQTVVSQQGEAAKDEIVKSSDQTNQPPMPASCKKMMSQAANTNPQGKAESKATQIAQQEVAAAQRLVVCDTGAALMEITGKENADRTIFVKESDEWAGAGGASITMTTALPAAGAVHELLHSFGFSDEYEYYSECEADTYCPYLQGQASPNLAVFKENSPYESDASARKKHSSQIPWFSKIRPKTLITTGTNLGTPQKSEIGLHQVGVCDKAETRVKSWRPGSKTTVMETVETAYIPEIYWIQISEGLGTKIVLAKSNKSGKATSIENSASPARGTR
ncbi:MAG: hypothetical protein JNM39_01365 [Bdellovibrionaceae bacterium]|nr:hypothetical protein [Pseudobdellovibrionaceae bacterium]